MGAAVPPAGNRAARGGGMGVVVPAAPNANAAKGMAAPLKGGMGAGARGPQKDTAQGFNATAKPPGALPAVPATTEKVIPKTVPGVNAARVAKFNRADYQNYRLETNVGTPDKPVWRIYYHGYIAPGETATAITRRHAGTVGPDGLARFNSATDRIVMEPGTRLYGEARLMEHRRIIQDKTNIGRAEASGTRRGNNQGGLDTAKVREYEAWERARNGK